MKTPQDEINSWAELTPEQKRAEIVALREQADKLEAELSAARAHFEEQERLRNTE
jgi:predicted Fe-S protein YdhL (DUF1289 family)